MKYLNEIGMSYFWNKIKNQFALINHTHTKVQVGLSNVDNTADATKNVFTATKLATNSDIGSAIRPVYFSNGVPVQTTFLLEKSVPANAKFTDTFYEIQTSNITIPVDSWIGTTIPYTAIVNGISLVKSNKTLVESTFIEQGPTSDENYKTYLEDIMNAIITPVDELQDTEKLVFKAWGDKPLNAISLKLIVSGEVK